MGKGMEKQIAFYMTQRAAAELDAIQELIGEKEGRVTKGYILNQAIYKYFEYVKELYQSNNEANKN